jgi:hypothetical protein
VFVSQGQFPVEMEVKAMVLYPDHLRVDTTVPVGVIQQGFDGKVAWLAGSQGFMELPPSFNAEFQRGLDLVGGWGVYRQALAGKAQVWWVGEETLEGKQALAVEWLAGPDKVKLYFDPSTHLLVGAKYRQTTPQGSAETLQVWSDFRGVAGADDGLKFPYRNVTYRDGAEFSETTAQSVKVNTKPDPAIFSKPNK